MEFKLSPGLELAMKLAEMQKQWEGMGATMANAMKWQEQIALNRSVFEPAIALSEQAKLATKILGQSLLYQQPLLNFPQILNPEIKSLAESIAGINDALSLKLGSITAAFDSPLAKQVQQTMLAFQSNINAISNTGILFGNQQAVTGAKDIALKAQDLFASIEDNKHVNKADLEKAKQEIVSYIKEHVETKKFLGLSAESWFSAILSILSALVTIYYAYNPPVVATAESISKHDLLQFQQDILHEVQQIQHADSVKRILKCNTWLRELPQFSARRLGKLQKETVVYVTNSTAGWAYIVCNDQKDGYPVSGWVRKEDLSKTK